jgi:hypothetical protein
MYLGFIYEYRRKLTEIVLGRKGRKEMREKDGVGTSNSDIF